MRGREDLHVIEVHPPEIAQLALPGFRTCAGAFRVVHEVLENSIRLGASLDFVDAGLHSRDHFKKPAIRTAQRLGRLQGNRHDNGDGMSRIDTAEPAITHAGDDNVTACNANHLSDRAWIATEAAL